MKKKERLFNMPKDREEIAQWDKVIAFREELDEKKLLTCTYESAEKFTDMVRDHLSKLLRDWFATKNDVPLITNFSSYLKYLKKD